MNIEDVREFCLGLPMVSEDMAFGDEYLLMRVCGKIFACIGLVRADYFVVKCDADYALDLRDRYEEIEPAWHWNKRYWNQIKLSGTLNDDVLKSLICHSYNEVVRKLPKRVRTEHPELIALRDERV
ncbi:MAG: MmcQ/YjbR family DNA-binding protein [Paramuribaculum sp.]|nr:MmcQ/YjbR family DNA-binding protein [Paramuribaculum sp.]